MCDPEIQNKIKKESESQPFGRSQTLDELPQGGIKGDVDEEDFKEDFGDISDSD